MILITIKRIAMRMMFKIRMKMVMKIRMRMKAINNAAFPIIPGRAMLMLMLMLMLMVIQLTEHM